VRAQTALARRAESFMVDEDEVQFSSESIPEYL